MPFSKLNGTPEVVFEDLRDLDLTLDRLDIDSVNVELKIVHRFTTYNAYGTAAFCGLFLLQ